MKPYLSMSDGLVEFSAVVIAHLLAVASPGPDFALVLRQSLVEGRTVAAATAVGIGCGILVHVTYSLLGVALLLRSSPMLFTVVQWAGAGYLAWLGWQALRSRSFGEQGRTTSVCDSVTWRGAWLRGFLTNLLNPKATLFFLALFTVVVSPATPKAVQVFYGLWMAVATMAWFGAVAWVFTRPAVRAAYFRLGVWVDRLMGVVLLGFAINLALGQWLH